MQKPLTCGNFCLYFVRYFRQLLSHDHLMRISFRLCVELVLFCSFPCESLDLSCLLLNQLTWNRGMSAVFPFGKQFLVVSGCPRCFRVREWPKFFICVRKWTPPSSDGWQTHSPEYERTDEIEPVSCARKNDARICWLIWAMSYLHNEDKLDN